MVAPVTVTLESDDASELATAAAAPLALTALRLVCRLGIRPATPDDAEAAVSDTGVAWLAVNGSAVALAVAAVRVSLLFGVTPETAARIAAAPKGSDELLTMDAMEAFAVAAESARFALGLKELAPAVAVAADREALPENVGVKAAAAAVEAAPVSEGDVPPAAVTRMLEIVQNVPLPPAPNSKRKVPDEQATLIEALPETQLAAEARSVPVASYHSPVGVVPFVTTVASSVVLS